ncbi:MAG: hypothetical protein ABJD07_09650 [Gemmatimonadaceae bacterium]
MKTLLVCAVLLAACDSGGRSAGQTACAHVLTQRDSISSDWGADADEANVLEGGVCLDPGGDAIGGIEIAAEASGRRVAATTDQSGHYVLRGCRRGALA